MSWSGLIFVVCCIVLAIWDGAAVLLYGVDGSISRWVADTSEVSPMIPFTFGVLCGHWFAPMRPKQTKAE